MNKRFQSLGGHIGPGPERWIGTCRLGSRLPPRSASRPNPYPIIITMIIAVVMRVAAPLLFLAWQARPSVPPPRPAHRR